VKHVKKVLGHEVKLYNYGNKKIINHKVGVIGGSGNLIPVHKELIPLKINTYITGVTVLNNYYETSHASARENKINLIGCTHYSTEKYACIKMCDYFKKLGLQCEFIEDNPIMEDI
jgi:putative NIF3 family GTP cyclohydrolase 1 type 2